jgi:hypothetical protein
MSWKHNLRKGRSHLIFCFVLIVAGTIVVRMEDSALTRETGSHPQVQLCGKAKAPAPCPVSPAGVP